MHHKPHTRVGSKGSSFLRNAATLGVALGLSSVAALAASTVVQSGLLTYEYYPGSDRPTVEDPSTRPALNTAGNVVGSDKNGFITSFESGTNFAETYANRIYGYFVPPTTGDYVFFIACDDDGDLFLSTDADPANKHLIAQESGWSGVRNYTAVGGGSQAADKRSDTFATTEWTDSDPVAGGTQIHLTQGQKYYIEAVHHEGGGGDNVAVTYTMAGQTPANGSAPTLTGSVIATDVPAGTVQDGTITVTTQPAGGTFAMASGSQTLSVAATTTSTFPIAYQWYKDGVAITGAGGASYTVAGPLVPSEAGSYTVKMSIPKSDGTLNTVTSSPAVIAIASGANFVTGSLKYEYFGGKSRGDVENGNGGAPGTGGTVGGTKSGAISIFESLTNFADNYANRISGWFVPAVTGDYTFLIAADDDSDLFLSTDDSPANKLMIAQETGWSGVRKYNTVGGGALAAKNSSTFGGNQWPTDADNDPSNGKQIHLVQGTKYYIEAVHHEGGGGDNIAVTYYTIDEDPATVAADGVEPRLSGSQVGIYVAGQTLIITNQPANITVFSGTEASFSVRASNDGFYPTTYQWFRNGVAINGATGRVYSFVPTAADSGATFSVKLNYFGNSGATVDSTAATLTVNPDNQSIKVAGGVKREFFSGADRGGVEAGRYSPPNSVTIQTNMEGFTNIADNYAERLSGLFTPTTTGDYVFFIASDDDSDLFLSTDATAAHKQLIAQELGWSGVRRWTSVPAGANGGTTDTFAASQKRSDQFSPDAGTTTPFATGIHLTAATPYYIEAVHHEGGGGDNLAVTYKMLADADPADGDAPAFKTTELSYITSPVTAATISTQPLAVQSYEAQSASFTVGVTTDAEVTPLYQWRKNGTPIDGATGKTYTIGFLSLGDSGNYDVVVTVPNFANNPITSAAAALTVLPAPVIRGIVKYDYFPGITDRTVVEKGNGGTPSTAGSVVGATKSGYIPIAETAVNYDNNYVSRISGFFIPPADADYVFYVNSDDDSDLFLSTDATPANKKLIAREENWSNLRQWTSQTSGGGNAGWKRSDQYTPSEWPDADSDPSNGINIHLLKDHLYYFEGVHHEGGGGDDFGITYKQVDPTDPSIGEPVNGIASALHGSVIGIKLVPATIAIGDLPVIAAAVATTNGVTLTFNHPMDATTVVKANFSLGAGVTVDSATSQEILQGNNVVSVVTLNTTGLLPNQTYTVAVTGVKDTKGNAVAAGTNVKVTTPVLTFTFDGDTPLPDGATLGGSATIQAAIGPDGSAALQLTDAVNSQQGALVIPSTLISNDPVTNFTTTFKAFIGLGSGNPADGMSVNFGQIDPNLNVTSFPAEEGATGAAISVDFDTYNNGGSGPGGQQEAPAFEIKLYGHIIAWIPLPQTHIVNDFWADVVVSVNSDNTLSAIYNGVPYFNRVPLTNAKDLVTGGNAGTYTPTTGEFLISARTGGEHARQAIDNLTISVNSKDNPGPTDIHIHVTRSGNNLNITWDGPGTLQSSPTVGTTAVWTAVAGASGQAATVPLGNGNLFFRISQ